MGIARLEEKVQPRSTITLTAQGYGSTVAKHLTGEWLISKKQKQSQTEAIYRTWACRCSSTRKFISTLGPCPESCEASPGCLLFSWGFRIGCKVCGSEETFILVSANGPAPAATACCVPNDPWSKTAQEPQDLPWF